MAIRRIAKLETLLKVCVLAVVWLGIDARPPVNRANGAFGLEEVISGELSSVGFTGTWISGTQFLYTDRNTGDVLKYDLSTLSSSVLVERPVLDEYRATSYELSADGLYLLIGYDLQAGFRHSTVSRFVTYDLINRRYSPVAGGALLQLVRLAPVGNALVFVLDNDIYYRSSSSFGANEQRITFNGVPGIFYNGVPDWVYEEEVLGSGSALWISPDGTWLAFARFNDTNVKTASYFHYGQPGSLESQYSDTVNIRYPKPGTTNPQVSLHLVDLTDLSSGIINIPAPVDVVSNDHILYAVDWVNDYEYYVIWTNRVQNLGLLQICPAGTGACQTVHQLSETAGWLDVVPPIADATGARLVTVLPQDQGQGFGNYAQVTLLSPSPSIRDLATETPLTFGRSVVTYIYGWDKINDTIYYQSTPENEPSQRHVYAVAADGSTAPYCLSCGVITPEGRACLYASASFSTDLSYLALTCSGPDPPHVSLYKTGSDSPLVVWEINESLRQKIEGRDLPEILNTEVDVPEGFQAKARLWLPPGADTSGATKYPMLVYVYGGPDSVQISDAFTLGWGAYLTTNRSIIYGLIDGRGSGLKGDKMKFSVYRRLGTVEIYDQIAVTAALLDQFPFIDSTRTAIWGWSYGGYATAMTLARDTSRIFKCGASVAPVTSWIYYDSIYTERYMGLPTPEDNLGGYNDSDVTRLVEGFRGKQFYLLHGNADDNVHYLQAMVLSRALELSNILFRQQSYPDENHSLRSVLLHVYGSMDQFWRQCFDLDQF